MTEQELNKYASQKRLQALLNSKFELQKNIQSLLFGSESESIEAQYKKLFAVFDETIKKEIKYLSEI